MKPESREPQFNPQTPEAPAGHKNQPDLFPELRNVLGLGEDASPEQINDRMIEVVHNTEEPAETIKSLRLIFGSILPVEGKKIWPFSGPPLNREVSPGPIDSWLEPLNASARLPEIQKILDLEEERRRRGTLTEKERQLLLVSKKPKQEIKDRNEPKSEEDIAMERMDRLYRRIVRENIENIKNPNLSIIEGLVNNLFSNQNYPTRNPKINQNAYEWLMGNIKEKFGIKYVSEADKRMAFLQDTSEIEKRQKMMANERVQKEKLNAATTLSELADTLLMEEFGVFHSWDSMSKHVQDYYGASIAGSIKRIMSEIDEKILQEIDQYKPYAQKQIPTQQGVIKEKLVNWFTSKDSQTWREFLIPILARTRTITEEIIPPVAGLQKKVNKLIPQYIESKMRETLEELASGLSEKIRIRLHLKTDASAEETEKEIEEGIMGEVSGNLKKLQRILPPSPPSAEPRILNPPPRKTPGGQPHKLESIGSNILSAKELPLTKLNIMKIPEQNKPEQMPEESNVTGGFEKRRKEVVAGVLTEIAKAELSKKESEFPPAPEQGKEATESVSETRYSREALRLLHEEITEEVKREATAQNKHNPLLVKNEKIKDRVRRSGEQYQGLQERSLRTDAIEIAKLPEKELGRKQLYFTNEDALKQRVDKIYKNRGGDRKKDQKLINHIDREWKSLSEEEKRGYMTGKSFGGKNDLYAAKLNFAADLARNRFLNIKIDLIGQAAVPHLAPEAAPATPLPPVESDNQDMDREDDDTDFDYEAAAEWESNISRMFDDGHIFSVEELGKTMGELAGKELNRDKRAHIINIRSNIQRFLNFTKEYKEKKLSSNDPTAKRYLDSIADDFYSKEAREKVRKLLQYYLQVEEIEQEDNDVQPPSKLDWENYSTTIEAKYKEIYGENTTLQDDITKEINQLRETNALEYQEYKLKFDERYYKKCQKKTEDDLLPDFIEEEYNKIRGYGKAFVDWITDKTTEDKAKEVELDKVKFQRYVKSTINKFREKYGFSKEDFSDHDFYRLYGEGIYINEVRRILWSEIPTNKKDKVITIPFRSTVKDYLIELKNKRNEERNEYLNKGFYKSQFKKVERQLITKAIAREKRLQDVILPKRQNTEGDNFNLGEMEPSISWDSVLYREMLHGSINNIDKLLGKLLSMRTAQNYNSAEKQKIETFFESVKSISNFAVNEYTTEKLSPDDPKSLEKIKNSLAPIEFLGPGFQAEVEAILVRHLQDVKKTRSESEEGEGVALGAGTYKFEAMDTTGGEVEDSVEAENDEDAQNKIKKMGYFLTRFTSFPEQKKKRKGNQKSILSLIASAVKGWFSNPNK